MGGFPYSHQTSHNQQPTAVRTQMMTTNVCVVVGGLAFQRPEWCNPRRAPLISRTNPISVTTAHHHHHHNHHHHQQRYMVAILRKPLEKKSIHCPNMTHPSAIKRALWDTYFFADFAEGHILYPKSYWQALTPPQKKRKCPFELQTRASNHPGAFPENTTTKNICLPIQLVRRRDYFLSCHVQYDHQGHHQPHHDLHHQHLDQHEHRQISKDFGKEIQSVKCWDQ